MRIIHVSRLCTTTMYNRIMRNNKVKINQSILKFNRVMVEGFAKNGLDTIVYSERPINKSNCSSTYLPAEEELDNGIKYHYCRGFNLSYIGIIYTIIATFLWICVHLNRDDDIVVLDTYQLALSTGTIAACKLKRIPCLGVVTDIPSKSVFQVNGGKVNIKSIYNDWLISQSDGLVLLTEQMNSVINPLHKPYIIIEGFADSEMANYPNVLESKYDGFTVMYTGGVDQAYGLDMLVEGFIAANIPNSQLIIYGGGPYVDEVIKYSENFDNIIYGGVVDNEIIVNEQMKASLLVNPRYTHHEFTKYSFPGKNIEYMVSGTPTLTTNLPGMPIEYKEHVFIIYNESIESFSKVLTEISNIPAPVLHLKGIKTKEWMLKEKSNQVQCKRIIDFIYSNYME